MNCSSPRRARFNLQRKPPPKPGRPSPSVARRRSGAKSGRGLPHSKTLRVHGGHSISRQLLDYASALALCHRINTVPRSKMLWHFHSILHLPVRIHFKFIRHRNPIRFEMADGFYHPLEKPCVRTTPPNTTATGRHWHQPVLDRVLMNIVEPCQARTLVCEPGFPKVEPHLAAGNLLKFPDQ